MAGRVSEHVLWGEKRLAKPNLENQLGAFISGFSDLPTLAKETGEAIAEGYRGAKWPELNETFQALEHSQREAMDPKSRISDLGRLATLTNAAIPGLAIPVPKGALRVFGGTSAKTADHEALAKAIEMEKQPNSRPGNIWQSTGWFRGPDSRWRFEIPDTGARWTDKVKPFPDRPDTSTFPMFSRQKLGEVLDHPELFRAYPELKDVDVGSTPMFSAFSGLRGYHDPEKNLIGLTGGKSQDVLSTGLHEIQHAIQMKEGFAIGGNTGQFLPPGFEAEWQAKKAVLDKVEDQIRALGANPRIIENAIRDSASGRKIGEFSQEHLNKLINQPELLDQWGQAYNDLNPLRAQQREAWDKYQSLAGEVESRNVQERHASGDYGTEPWTTPGYPEESQIVQFAEPGQGQTPPQGQGPSLDIRGYHGTPHKFDPEPGAPFGRFRTEAIGSGEGAQAYGYGHYVAGNPQVAEGYQKSLSSGQIGYLGDSTVPEVQQGLEILNRDRGRTTESPGEIHKRMLENYQQTYDSDLPDKLLAGGRVGLESQIRALRTLDPSKLTRDRGSLLEVRIKPDEHELLDWDSPVKNMPQAVQEKLKGVADWKPGFENKTGEELYQSLSYDQGQEAASAALHEAGVPGIRYLDAGSRGLRPVEDIASDIENLKSIIPSYERAWEKDPSNLSSAREVKEQKTRLKRLEQELEQTKNPTSNYVIFHPSNLHIEARNGQRLHPVEHNPWAAPAPEPFGEPPGQVGE